MFDLQFQGLPIEVTLSAARELMKERKDLYDVLEILEQGYDSSPSPRKENIIERSIQKGNKEYKAVVARTAVRYLDGFQEEVWRLIHFGKFAYKKERRKQ